MSDRRGAKTCSRCGAPSRDDFDRFCGECGAAFVYDDPVVSRRIFSSRILGGLAAGVAVLTLIAFFATRGDDADDGIDTAGSSQTLRVATTRSTASTITVTTTRLLFASTTTPRPTTTKKAPARTTTTRRVTTTTVPPTTTTRATTTTKPTTTTTQPPTTTTDPPTTTTSQLDPTTSVPPET